MLKNLFTGVFAIALAASSVPVVTNQSVHADDTVTITTPFEFCEYFINHASVNTFYETGCSGYSNVPGDQLVTTGTFLVPEGVNVVLKNMNIRYDMIRAPFTLAGGYLIIDGGAYVTAGSCFFNLSYLYNGETANNVKIKIISGDFAAEGGLNRYSMTPICVNYSADLGDEFNQAILESILAPGSYYAEFGTTTEIHIASNLSKGVENYAKMYDDVSEITYINRSRLSVKPRNVTPNPEPEPTPEIPETPAEEPKTTPETPTIIIPKAPNTGVAK